jgi:peptidoglycan/LPS O-acetylase OafA/YrhL
MDYWPEFFCGMLVYASRHSALPSSRPLALLGIATIGCLGFHLRRTADPLPFAAGFALLLIVLQPFDAKLAVLRGLKWLGTCGAFSYSLYLMHVPIASPVENLLRRICPANRPAFLLVVLAAVGGAIAGSWIFYRCVEAPIERFRRNLRTRSPRLLSAFFPGIG